MTNPQLTHRPMRDSRFLFLLTVAHAAVAIPALYLWAAVCDRARRSSR
jgi:hypothetical protein